MVPVRTVPGAPSHILGLANLRGDLIAVVDLRVCLSAEHVDHGEDVRLLVMPHGAFLVDEVLDTVDLPEDLDGGGEWSELVRLTWSREGRVFQLLDERALAML